MQKQRKSKEKVLKAKGSVCLRHINKQETGAKGNKDRERERERHKTQDIKT